MSGATSVKVTLSDGKQYPAKVLGTDASTDVGVIHINAPATELHPIALADSDTAQVGDPVVAIGSPFSLPETTVGIVSQTGRSIKAPNDYTIPNAIQTDAAINPGNSGGPLLDASGHVLGLNDQIETNNSNGAGQGSSSGVGFAIPSDTVQRIASQIISGQKVQHAFVGVSWRATRRAARRSPSWAGIAGHDRGPGAAWLPDHGVDGMGRSPRPISSSPRSTSTGRDQTVPLTVSSALVRLKQVARSPSWAPGRTTSTQG